MLFASRQKTTFAKVFVLHAAGPGVGELMWKSVMSNALNTFGVHVLRLPTPFTKCHIENPLQGIKWSNSADIFPSRPV